MERPSYGVNDFTKLLTVEETDLSTVESQASLRTCHPVGIAFVLGRLYHRGLAEPTDTVLRSFHVGDSHRLTGKIGETIGGSFTRTTLAVIPMAER